MTFFVSLWFTGAEKMKRFQKQLFIVAAVLVTIGFTSICISGDTESKPFIEGAEFDKNIPTPESVIGFGVGQKAVTYEQLVKYLKVLEKASERVKLYEYGKTHEGRNLYYLIITSKENQKKLELIKADNARLSDPRMIKPADADKIIETMPAVAFLNYGIHGDELSSSDAAMYVIYHLAAAKDKQTLNLLDNIVIIVEPMINPDGRERFLGQIRQMTGVIENPDVQAMQHTAMWSRGRGNHYLFDMNRDWIIQLQPEVHATAPVILSWNPHLLVDSHEQGPYDNYLFDPPNDPVNSQLSESITAWRKIFSSDQAKAFNKFGWSYFTRDWYSDWGPIYTNSWANLLGAVGILYEQGRANSASVKQPTGIIMTYRQTVHHHIVSTFANLRTLCDNRKKILKDFYEDRKWAVTEDKGSRFLILPPQKDKYKLENLIDTIKCHGIEVEYARSEFNAEKLADTWGEKEDNKKFPEGTAVISLKQPHRRLIECLLDFDPRFDDKFLLKERTEIANYRNSLVYDITAWNLTMAYGVEGFWAQTLSNVELTKENKIQPAARLTKKGDFGYIVDFSGSNIYPALVKLFEQKCQMRAGTKPFKFDGKEYCRGSIVLRRDENPENLLEILQKINADYNLEIKPADTALVEDGPDLGTSKFVLLTEPKVAIACQWPISPTSFGSVWFLLDNQAKLKCSLINIQNLGMVDLRTYNVLILPDSTGFGRMLGEAAVEKIKQWVENGGTLIAAGGSASFAAEANSVLSKVRLRKDVLAKLDEYAEAVERERIALNIKIDPNKVWGVLPEKAPAEPNKTKKEQLASDKKPKDDIEKLKRDDQWKAMFSPSGAFLAGAIDPEQWLAYGIEGRLPVYFEGADVFMSKQPVRTAVRLTEEKELRLSGLLWPEARERIADSAYATVESLGNGQVILFAADPSFRMWMAAEQRLLLNAVLLGPGLGTTPPRPW
jgi:hypothetical protein